MALTAELEEYFDRLWPICRSITGNGLRESLRIISEIIPIKITEVKTGTTVFDWSVPKEWNIRDAYIQAPDGRRICEFSRNNLHIVNYSVPVNKELSYEELQPHLHYIESMPDAIPYVTSYYRENWGFCLSYKEFLSLPKTGAYRVVIESTISDGSLSYGDVVLKGETDEEVLFSTYVCHPSMANNELSGPLVQAFLYRKIAAMPRRRYTYRFVFAPETIGVICYLAEHGERMKKKLKAGYVITCCGDSGNFVYKRSRRGDTLADRVAAHVLRYQDEPHEVIPFSVGGSDERQYCSPGFDLPVGSLTRSMYQRYKEYHTSLDDKSFISFAAMEKTIDTYFSFARLIEINASYRSALPYGEPQLGKRGLYPSSVNPQDNRRALHNRMHVLAYADGGHDVLEMAELRGVPAFELEPEIAVLREAGLLVTV